MRIQLEHLPDVLVGKLLDADLACQCSIGIDADGALGLFVTPVGTLEPLDQRFPGFVGEIARAAAEFFNDYPALARLVVHASGDGQPIFWPCRTVRLAREVMCSQAWEALSHNFPSGGAPFDP